MNAVCKRITEEHEANEARERNFLRYPLENKSLDIDSELSGFGNDQKRLNGRRAGKCSECGHICCEMEHEIVCCKCGLVQEQEDPTPEESIRSMFAIFDLLEIRCGLLQRIEQPGSDGGKDFLAMRRTHYYKSIHGVNKTINCSVLDRERGYIRDPGDLPEELSYPELCVLTFYDIPWIDNPAMPTSIERDVVYHTEYTDSELAAINVMVNEKYGTMFPRSAKTVKKYREQSIAKPGIVPYSHQTYEGTPIGKLLEDHPVPGRAALNSLFEYFMEFYFEGKKYCVWPREPTRGNMVRAFQGTPSCAGVKFADEDLAEKRFDLLVEHGIIKGLKGYTNQRHLLYYATQKSGPHQIPTGPRTDTQKYYISNNKS
jgi:hypothetical protein